MERKTALEFLIWQVSHTKPNWFGMTYLPARPGDSYWVLYCIYNICKYWVYPILTMGIVIFLIQYYTIIFFEKIVEFLGRSNKLVKNVNKGEEKKKRKKMMRMRRDQFFRKCRKKVKKKRMRSGR